MTLGKCTCALLVVVAVFFKKDVSVSAQSSSGTIPSALIEFLDRVKTGGVPMPTAPQQQQPPPDPSPTNKPQQQQQSQFSGQTASPQEIYSRFMELMKQQQQTAPAQNVAPAPHVQPNQQQIPPNFDPFGSPVQQQPPPQPPPPRSPQIPMQLTVQQPAQQPPPAPKPAKPAVEYTRQGTIDFVPADHKAVQPQVYHQPPPQQPSYYTNRATSQPAYQNQQQTSQVNWGSHAAPVSSPHHQYNRHLTPQPSWTSRMVLSPDMHTNMLAQAKQSGLTRHYEEHGCIDPVAYMPPGTQTVGLSMGCSNPFSQQLCQTAAQNIPGAVTGRNNNMAMMMMHSQPHMRELLETCLSRTPLTKAMIGMSRSGGQGGMNPAAMAMMMGAGGGGGGGMMPAMMMMNMMNNNGGGQSQSVVQPPSSSSSSLPAGAALPGGGTQNPYNQAQAQTPPPNKCATILPLVMMQGGEGGLMSPEGGDIVRDMRRQIFPYSCQEVGAGMMPVRMCCPGKVNHPSMMEFISAGAGA